MTQLTQTTPAVAGPAETTNLLPREHAGWLGGLAPLWNSEWRRWWRPRNALASLLIWLLICYGFNLLTMAGSRVNPEIQAEVAAEMASSGQLPPGLEGESGPGSVDEMLFLGGLMMLFFTSVGAIIAGQDKLIGERQSGLMASTLARPVTRSAYLLSKLAALPGMLLTMALLPVALVVPTAAVIYGAAPSLATIAVMPLLLTAAIVAFYTLTLLLGALFERRAPVLGVGMVMCFVVMQLLPQLLTLAPLPVTALASAGGFLVAAGLFLALAVQRFTTVELR